MLRDWNHLSSYMNELCNGGIAGCACLVYEKGEEQFRSYCGYSNMELKERLNIHTIYRIYSLTKLYTAVAVLQLVEKNKISLSASVSDYLPEFSNLYLNRVAENGWNFIEPAKKPLLISHLLSMTSGISYAYDNDGPTMCKTREMVKKFKIEHDNFTVREYASLFSQIPLAFEPGTHFLYGAGYDILAAVVEVVSGENFGEYLKKHIWEPLELKSTMFRLQSEQEKRNLCTMYQYGISESNADTNQFIPIKDRDRFYEKGALFEEGGGGILSSLDDYMCFMRMLSADGQFKGKQILSSSMVGYLRTSQLNPIQEREFAMEGYGYGCGVRVKTSLDGTSPVGEYGWYGMSGSYALIDPVYDLCLVYLQQMIPGRDKEIHPKLRRCLYEDFFR